MERTQLEQVLGTTRNLVFDVRHELSAGAGRRSELENRKLGFAGIESVFKVMREVGYRFGGQVGPRDANNIKRSERKTRPESPGGSREAGGDQEAEAQAQRRGCFKDSAAEAVLDPGHGIRAG